MPRITDALGSRRSRLKSSRRGSTRWTRADFAGSDNRRECRHLSLGSRRRIGGAVGLDLGPARGVGGLRRLCRLGAGRESDALGRRRGRIPLLKRRKRALQAAFGTRRGVIAVQLGFHLANALAGNVPLAGPRDKIFEDPFRLRSGRLARGRRHRGGCCIDRSGLGKGVVRGRIAAVRGRVGLRASALSLRRIVRGIVRGGVIRRVVQGFVVERPRVVGTPVIGAVAAIASAIGQAVVGLALSHGLAGLVDGFGVASVIVVPRAKAAIVVGIAPLVCPLVGRELGPAGFARRQVRPLGKKVSNRVQPRSRAPHQLEEQGSRAGKPGLARGTARPLCAGLDNSVGMDGGRFHDGSFLDDVWTRVCLTRNSSANGGPIGGARLSP